jgi:hypothetical protein
MENDETSMSSGTNLVIRNSNFISDQTSTGTAEQINCFEYFQRPRLLLLTMTRYLLVLLSHHPTLHKIRATMKIQ